MAPSRRMLYHDEQSVAESEVSDGRRVEAADTNHRSASFPRADCRRPRPILVDRRDRSRRLRVGKLEVFERGGFILGCEKTDGDSEGLLKLVGKR